MNPIVMSIACLCFGFPLCQHSNSVLSFHMLCPTMSASLLMLASAGNSSSTLGNMHRSTDDQREERGVGKPGHPEVAISLEEYETVVFDVRTDLHNIIRLAKKAHQKLNRFRDKFHDPCEPLAKRARHDDGEAVSPSGCSWWRGELLVDAGGEAAQELQMRTNVFQPPDQQWNKHLACSFKMMQQEEASGGEGSQRVEEQDALLELLSA